MHRYTSRTKKLLGAGGSLLLVGLLLASSVVAKEISPEAKAPETVAVGEEFLYDSHGRRDPFWRLVNPSGAIVNYDHEMSASDLALEGIMTGKDGRNVAIINGQLLKTNDTLGAYRVKSIDPSTVILQKDQELIKLKLKKED